MDSSMLYRNKMREFYDRISVYVNTRPAMRSFIESREKDYFSEALPEDQSAMLLFDWFIFDYRDAYGKSGLDNYLEENKLEWEDKATYAGFKDNMFGMYQVKAVKTGKESVLSLLPSGKEYHVLDTTATKSMKKGDVIVTRVIAFRDIHILTGPALLYPEAIADTLRVAFADNDKEAGKFKYTPMDLIRMLDRKPGKKKKPGNLYSAAEAAGIKPEKVDELMQKLKDAAKDRSVDPMALFKEFTSTAGNFREDTLQGLAGAYFDKWNSVVADKNAEKGPLETTLISGAMHGAVMRDVKPLEISGEAERKQKVDEYMLKWLDEPLAALEGRTPRQAIIREREARGDSQKEIAYSLTFDIPVPDKAKKKAEKLYDEALALMKEEKYDEAILKYLKYIKLWNGNHVVWYNLAMCHIFMDNENSSLACLKNSLEIKPDYEYAAQGIRNLIKHGNRGIKSKARHVAEKYGITGRKPSE